MSDPNKFTQEGESFEDYKVRRKAENGLLKEYLRGVWVKDD